MLRLPLRELALLFLLAGTLPAQKEADQKIEPGSGVPTGKVLEWTSAEGQPYWYRVPKSTPPGRPRTLLLMCHGTGSKWGWPFWNYPIASGQFRGDDIVVAPEGLTQGQGDTFNFVQGKKDGDQIAGLIHTFKKKMGVTRVYLYGHSQGAFFAYWFAGEHPDLVDGIVAHAGNVLDVKHPPLAKTKVGIGILHGRADAVVGVECAFRTEKIYKEQGYAKLRLKIVEGLNEQTGHWPLSKDVGEMLAWLDQVSAASPVEAADAALAILRSPVVDLPALGGAVERSEALAKKAKDKDAAAARERLQPAKEALDLLAAAHRAALDAARAADPKAQDGPWVAHFLAVDEGLGGIAGWSSGLKDLKAASQQQQKSVERAIRDLQKGDIKSLGPAVKAYEDGPLAPSTYELETALSRWVEKPPPNASKSDLAKASKILGARATTTAEGRKRAEATTAEALVAIRAKHPSLNPPAPSPPDGSAGR